MSLPTLPIPFPTKSADARATEHYRKLGEQWRKSRGFVGRGGYVAISFSKANGWTCDLSKPNEWRPGIVAVPEDDSALYMTTGGNARDGAQRWVALHKSA